MFCTENELNLIKTFECGQCFRWSADENGIYRGVAYGKALTIWSQKGEVFCDAVESDLPFWREYFDLNADYATATAKFTEPPYLKTCADFGYGIRILRQEPWEALCSFIISQCNNIPRIKGIIETLCRLYGEEISEGHFAFPTVEKVASLSLNDLAPLRSGYRAQYILNAAIAVTQGVLDFENLRVIAPDKALKELLTIRGIGVKVANCFMLFGLHMMDSFPIDIWIKRALEEHFPKNYDPKILGNFAGLAQQYIFYYARSHG